MADEVRKLAERTSGATSEIQQTIEAIQSEMEGAGHLLDEVKTHVGSGVAAIGSLIEPLTALRERAADASKGLHELATATREQQAASELIARSTERIAGTAELNHASATKSRETARQLGQVTEHLMGSMRRFRLQ